MRVAMTRIRWCNSFGDESPDLRTARYSYLRVVFGLILSRLAMEAMLSPLSLPRVTALSRPES